MATMSSNLEVLDLRGCSGHGRIPFCYRQQGRQSGGGKGVGYKYNDLWWIRKLAYFWQEQSEWNGNEEVIWPAVLEKAVKEHKSPTRNWESWWQVQWGWGHDTKERRGGLLVVPEARKVWQAPFWGPPVLPHCTLREGKSVMVSVL